MAWPTKKPVQPVDPKPLPMKFGPDVVREHEVEKGNKPPTTGQLFPR